MAAELRLAIFACALAQIAILEASVKARAGLVADSGPETVGEAYFEMAKKDGSRHCTASLRAWRTSCCCC